MVGARGLGYRLAIAFVAMVFLLTVAASANASINRRRADAIAVRILRPARSPSSTVLFGLPAPIPASSAVFEGVPGATFQAHRFAHSVWLFWEDQDYQALFAHPSQLLLIDSKTGRVVRRQSLEWLPLVDGQRPAFLASSAAYHNRAYWIASAHIPTIRAGRKASDQAAAHAATQPPLAIQPGELKHDCLIMIGDREEPALSGSFAAMLQWAKQLHLNNYPTQATDVASLQDTVAQARAFGGCNDVFLFIAGHGTPPPNWTNPADHQQYPGGPAAVNLDSGAAKRSGPNGWTVERKLLTPDDISNLLLDNPTVDFKIKIESCFSGRFADTLVDPKTRKPIAPNLQVLELSSPADRVSYGQILVDQTDARGRVTAHNVPINDNPFGAGEFTNGDYHGLVQWDHSTAQINATDGSLAQGIAASFTLGMPFNAGTGKDPQGGTIEGVTPSDPLLFNQTLTFKPTVEAHDSYQGFAVTGWTNGRFDAVQIDAPPGAKIVSFDAHGHNCVMIDNFGHVVPNVSTLQPDQYIVSVRCDRKPVDDDVDIYIQLGSGTPQQGATTRVRFYKNGNVASDQTVPIHI